MISNGKSFAVSTFILYPSYYGVKIADISSISSLKNFINILLLWGEKMITERA